MPGKRSAGLLVYRRRTAGCEVFLVHPGGPFWQSKDLGAWSIPKGELSPDEDPLDAARREFAEETGIEVSGDFVPLAPIRQSGGKTIDAWAVEGECDPATIRSNTFQTEWPPRSGQLRQFPEVDRAAWFAIDDEAGRRIIKGQRGLLDQLRQLLGPGSGPRALSRADRAVAASYGSPVASKVVTGPADGHAGQRLRDARRGRRGRRGGVRTTTKARESRT